MVGLVDVCNCHFAVAANRNPLKLRIRGNGAFSCDQLAVMGNGTLFVTEAVFSFPNCPRLSYFRVRHYLLIESDSGATSSMPPLCFEPQYCNTTSDKLMWALL